MAHKVGGVFAGAELIFTKRAGKLALWKSANLPTSSFCRVRFVEVKPRFAAIKMDEMKRANGGLLGVKMGWGQFMTVAKFSPLQPQ